MGKRHRKKKKRRATASGNYSKTQDQKSEIGAVSTPQQNERGYWLKRLKQATGRPDQQQKARELLDRLWPRDSGQASRETIERQRLAWLLNHWPQQAFEELKSLNENMTPALWRVVSASVLLLSDHDFEQLCSRSLRFTDEWLREAKILRQASQAISQEDDDLGLQLLKQIGLRSSFRNGRMFLRGLSAYYRRRDQEAFQAWSQIERDSLLASAVRRLIVMSDLGPELDEQTSETAASELDGGFAEMTERAGIPESLVMDRIAQLIGYKRYNAAFREAAGYTLHMDTVARESLVRDLASALICSGLSPAVTMSRVTRAFTGQLNGFQLAHLKALTEESEKTNYRESPWTSLDRRLARGEGDFDERSRTLARADLSAQRAKFCLEMAENMGMEQSDPYDFLYDDEEFFDEEIEQLVQDAIDLLEQAVRLDPASVNHWLQLIEVFVKFGKDDQVGRTIERMVKALPDHPQTLLLAVRHAAKRKAWHKALRYIRQVIEKEPLNRDARDQQSWLLLHIGREKFRQFDLSASENSYQQAIEVPHRTAESQLKALAETTAFYHRTGRQQRASELRSQTLALEDYQWLFIAYYIIGDEHLQNAIFGRRGSRRRGRARGSSAARAIPEKINIQPNPQELPQKPPVPGELKRLLSLWKSAEGVFESLPKALAELLSRAIAFNLAEIKEREEINTALEIIDSIELRLRLVEHALELFPDDSALIVLRYTLALDLKLPIEYFREATNHLQLARQHHLDNLDGHADSENIFFTSLSDFVLKTIDRLEERLRRYLNSNKRRSGLKQKSRSEADRKPKTNPAEPMQSPRPSPTRRRAQKRVGDDSDEQRDAIQQRFPF
jgi:hypothetical protein